LAASEGLPSKSFLFHNKVNLDQQLQRFWEIEKLSNKARATEKVCLKGTSRSLPHETEWDITFENSSTLESNSSKRVYMKKEGDSSTVTETFPGIHRFTSAIL
jgi:hypothetical protein